MSSHDEGPNELARLVGPVWSPTKTADALDVSLQELQGRRRSGSVLAVPTTDGSDFYPVSQFVRENGRVTVKAGVLPLLQALHAYDEWTVAVLLHTPSPELQGMTPLDWLGAGGDPDAVTRLGEAVAREWSSGDYPGDSPPSQG